MKKLALLLVSALLAACGGGGGSGSTAATGGSTPSKETAVLTVTISEKVGRTSPVVTTATDTLRRVVVTNPNLLDESGKPVKFTLTGGDYLVASTTKPIPTPPPLSFVVPLADGYRVEVMDYEVSSTTFSSYSSALISGADTFGNQSTFYIVRPETTTMKKPYNLKNYGYKTVNVRTTGTTSAAVTVAVLTDVAITTPSVTNLTTQPGKIPSNLASFSAYSTQYKVAANFASYTTPFNYKRWGLKKGYTAIQALNAATSTVFDTISAYMLGPSPFPANSTQMADTYYFSGEFYPKDTLLLPGENPFDFVYKNGVANSAPLYTPTGTIGTAVTP